MSIEVMVWVWLFGCLALGVPIFVSIGMATILVLSQTSIPLTIVPLDLYKVSEMFPLIAIPCFILAGGIMEKAGMALQIVKVAEVLMGRMKGGLGLVTIAGCSFFAAMIGSAPATVAAMGALMIPTMIKKGYDKNHASAICCTGGSLGILIPPSNPLIIYGVVGNVSISSLFMAGFVPGFLVIAALMLTIYLMARKQNIGGYDKPFSSKELMAAMKEGIWSLFAPVIILGGIYSGIFTPVEASVIAVVYATFVGFFITKELNWNGVAEALRLTNISAAMVLIIVGVSILFGRFLTMYKVPQSLAEAITSYTTEPLIVLGLIGVCLFILGMFMETLATILILTPILLPLIKSIGVDPVHFGILMIMISQVGMLTPPLGVNLFVAMGIANTTLEGIAKAAVPFILVLLTCTVLVALFPQIVLFLPELLG